MNTEITLKHRTCTHMLKSQIYFPTEYTCTYTVDKPNIASHLCNDAASYSVIVPSSKYYIVPNWNILLIK